MINLSKKFSFCLFVSLLILPYPVLAQQLYMPIADNHLKVSFNGKFIFPTGNKNSKANSMNGTYWCQYDIGQVNDEWRELLNFKLYERDQLLFNLNKAPGSDLLISNSGIVAFVDTEHHYKHEVSIHFYSPEGQHLFSETFKSPTLFGFSPPGSKFVAGTAEQLFLLSIPDHRIKSYPSADQFAISEDERLLATAQRGLIHVYAEGKLISRFNTGFFYTRKISISAKHNQIAVIDKKNINVYSLTDGNLLFNHKLTGKNSFRDLYINDGKIYAGVHYRDKGISRGVLKIYDMQGNLLTEKDQATKKFKTFQEHEKLQKPSLNEGQIPWPFFPFDSTRIVWNYYEQHMGRSDPYQSYLHQGLDIITPIGEPVYAVTDGIVKCVLTFYGASIYWRLAISDEQTAEFSKGWLYAHLIESSIQFDVGDTVNVHDYLGDIIQWANNWGHIHFVQIQDSGLVWKFDDNEWGITHNPLTSLRTYIDTDPPIIEHVFDSSKFVFCINETSTYLDADSLYGDIDIIAKVTDHIGGSPWDLPAFETYYWVKKLPTGQIVFPRTLGQKLNHAFDFYKASYYIPYVDLIYKRDFSLLPTTWMSKKRNFYHILTNSNGDSVLDLSEKELAFKTTNYADGDYRIFIEAVDESGNSTIDSMDVTFRNDLASVHKRNEHSVSKYQLGQNYPNPFNPETRITFSLPHSGLIKLTIYNVLGDEVQTLINGHQEAGVHRVNFNATNLPSGIYLYKLEAGNFVETKKMIVIQ